MLLALILIAQPIAVSGDWAAFDRGASCEAMSRSLLVPRKGEPQPHIAISFDRGGSRRGELSVALRRPSRPGSSVVMTIGDQPFLLPARGAGAWSRGPTQENAIIAAIRSSTGMRVEARDLAGRRMVDRYVLSGAPTAIDAAAAACAR
ncbi:MAG: hypothetical protein LH610_06640, partial [Sphingomonas bacterium]|nr:hypothetical protein [Sphingomonas bacterium]